MKLIVILFVMVTSNVANADWSNIFSSTNMTGCSVGAAGGYAFNMSQPTSAQAQGAIVGCLIGGFGAWLFDRNMAGRYAQKERADKQELARILREYRRQDASNYSQDEMGRYFIEKEVVPATAHPDGSISMEHLRVRIRKAGTDVLLGD